MRRKKRGGRGGQKQFSFPWNSSPSAPVAPQKCSDRHISGSIWGNLGKFLKKSSFDTVSALKEGLNSFESI